MCVIVSAVRYKVVRYVNVKLCVQMACGERAEFCLV
jgi:hypothetical protein